jgi:hypothetical protein
VRSAAAAALVVALAAPSAALPQQPRWAGLDGVTLGGPVDDLLARGGACQPAQTTREIAPGVTIPSVAAEAFGYALPHHHELRDSAAVRLALALGTICYGSILEHQGWVAAVAVDRGIVAMIVSVGGNPDDTLALPPSADSVRRIAYTAWGRPTHHSLSLDTWWGQRYRSYFLVPQYPERIPARMRITKLILLDVVACTAFDRRVHRAGARGEAGAC